MADPVIPTPEPQPEFPQPQPVFEISYEHLQRPGGVFPQMYAFLWFSVAFVIGAMLPWAADGSMVILQPLLLVIAIGCVWSSVTGIRWRRLIFWPVLTIEIFAFVFLFLYFGEVKDQDTYQVILESETVKAAQIQSDIDHYNKVTVPRSKWGFMDLSVSATSVLFSDPGSEERAMFDHAWRKFGIGFHMTWLTTLFVGLFVVFQIVLGVINAKPKEDPAEARRAARRVGPAKKGEDDAGKDGGKDGGKDAAKDGGKDGGKTFAANTTMKAVTEDDVKGTDS